MNAIARPTKPFAWSYSKLKNFETCGRRYNEIDLKKSFKEGESENLAWGNQLHESMAAAISKGKPLPITMQRYQGFVDTALKYGQYGVLTTELKLAFDRGFMATSYFDNATWFRGVVDLLLIAGDQAIMWDWKSGKILEDLVQLGLFATMVFAHNPPVQTITTSYIWLGNDALTNETWTRADMPKLWADLMPRVKRLEEAYYSGSYLPEPGGLCKRYCPVETCEYHGRGSY